MSTLIETLHKFGGKFPEVDIVAEDLPVIILTALMANNIDAVHGLLLAMAVRIEELEEEIFKLKFEGKNG